LPIWQSLTRVNHVASAEQIEYKARAELGRIGDTTTWYDRVVSKLRQIEECEKSDKETFRELFKYLDNYQSKNDGEALVREGDGAAKRYKGERVFSFSVKGGKIIVHPARVEPQSFADLEQAIDRMAELMAQAAHRPGDN
jgi:hypothetical protein